ELPRPAGAWRAERLRLRPVCGAPRRRKARGARGRRAPAPTRSLPPPAAAGRASGTSELLYDKGRGPIYLNALKSQDAQATETTWLTAVRAAESKKATDIKALDLPGIPSFTDYFVICSGSNPKQIQAIADEVGLRLKERGEHPLSLEGYSQAEWILADYGDFLVHIFSEKARNYYDLERLWRSAKTLPIPAE